MRWQPAIAGFSIGLVYAVVYFFLAFGASGAGHGTGLFFVAILPYGLGLLVFPALGFFAGNLKLFVPKVFFLSILVVHYALVVNFLRLDWIRDPIYVEKSWNHSPWSILLPTAFYIVGQIVLWALFVRSLTSGRYVAAEHFVGGERG